jgi:hypothetical protein
MAEYVPEAGHYVECQPMHGNQPRGASFNTMIQEVMKDGTYRIIRKGKDRFIKRKEILCRNLPHMVGEEVSP